MSKETIKSLESYLATMVGLRSGGIGNIPKAEKPKGYHYHCVEDLLLQEGVNFSPDELSIEQKQYVDGFMSFVRPQTKQCFRNAQVLTSIEGENRIKYHEGIAIFHIPILHAWNTIDGKIIDITWSLIDGYANDVVYRGVEFPLNYIHAKQLETETYLSLLYGERDNGADICKMKFNPELLKTYQYGEE